MRTYARPAKRPARSPGRSHKTVYRNRFQHDAARSAPRNVSTNIRLTPRTLFSGAHGTGFGEGCALFYNGEFDMLGRDFIALL